jgi:glycerophosphoryl diester phosphodiesterase
MKQPFIWAHRGASALAPENTMTSFQAALSCGADGIELDVHLSADGVPVVIHDNTLERTTDGAGRVEQVLWPNLQELDAGSWYADDYSGEPIPSLEEVLRAFSGQLRLNVEIKEFAAGKAVLELLSNFPDADILVSSFNCDLLSKLKTEKRELPLAVLFEGSIWSKALAFAKELQAGSFHPRIDKLSRPMVSSCHELGLAVYPWTADKPHVVRKIQRIGVDGFFANNPEKARTAWFSV